MILKLKWAKSDFPVVQGPRLCAPKAGDPRLDPWSRNKIPPATTDIQGNPINKYNKYIFFNEVIEHKNKQGVRAPTNVGHRHHEGSPSLILFLSTSKSQTPTSTLMQVAPQATTQSFSPSRQAAEKTHKHRHANALQSWGCPKPSKLRWGPWMAWG